MARPPFNVRAGNFAGAVYFDGSPIWPKIEYTPYGTHDKIELYGVSIAGLHDLKYVVDRLLSQIPADEQ